MSAFPHLSLIVPVHQGAEFIEQSLEQMLADLSDLDAPFELIVVCDGCTDGTAERARRLFDPRIRVLEYAPNEGKGHAITVGAIEAQGRLIGWLDADLDIHPDVIVRAVRRFDEDEDIDAVVGSKRHPDSEVDYPLPRRFTSWCFQMLVRLLLRVDVRDTQVGAKVFRREMLETVMPLLLIKRYAFDVEVLAVGAEFGFDRVRETSIRLDYKFSGTGINSQAVWRMFVDTLAIAYRIHLRHWYVRRYAAHQRRRMDSQIAAHAAHSAPPAWPEREARPLIDERP